MYSYYHGLMSTDLIEAITTISIFQFLSLVYGRKSAQVIDFVVL
jgi:hypothetical protein